MQTAQFYPITIVTIIAHQFWVQLNEEVKALERRSDGQLIA